MLPWRQVNLDVLFASPVIWGSFPLASDLRMELEQGLCVIPFSSRNLQNVCHKNESSSHFLNHSSKKGIIQLCWQGFLFPAVCGFCSSISWSLKSLSQMYVRMVESGKRKMLLRHDKKTDHHHWSPLWFRSGLMSVKQELLRERLTSGLGANQDLSPPTTIPFQQLSSGDLFAEGHRSMGLRRAVWVSPLKPSHLSCTWQWKYLAQFIIAWC